MQVNRTVILERVHDGFIERPLIIFYDALVELKFGRFINEKVAHVADI